MSVAIAALGFITVWLSSAAGQEMRTWSDKSGKFKIKAKLVESSGNKVVLEKEDGSQVTIPLDKLNEADQKAVADMGSSSENPFQTVKPAKKAAKKSRVVDEEEDEPPAKKSATKKKATVIDGDEEESVKKPAKKKKVAVEEEESEEEGDVSGEPKVVTPRWSGAKEILAAAAGEKWSLSIEAPKEPAAARKGRPVAIPSKIDFFEHMKGMVLNPVCRRAAIGYVLDKAGPRRPTTRRAREGGAGSEGQTRIVLCDLQTGKRLGAGAVSGKLVPLALSDSGEQLLMRREDAGFGKPDLLETWALTTSGISRELQWSPHDERMPGGHKIQWAAYIDEGRFVTASSAGFLVVWNADTAKPLRYMKINGQGRPALSPDRKYVAFGTDKQIGVLDLAALEVVAMLEPKQNLAFPVLSFTPAGTRLVCGAFDRILVWDVATGALYREIPLAGFNAQIGESIPCPSEDHFLLGNSLLVDMDSQARLWTYRGQEAAGMLGGVCWFVVSSHDSAGALVPAVLPHAAAQEQIQKAMQSPDFFIVKPGCTVKVNVSALADPAEREKAQAALTKKLEANGCQVAPNAGIELVASVETGQRRELSYHGMGGPFGPGSTTYKFQEYASRLKFLLQGQTLWEIVGGNNPGFMISLKQGETIEQFLRAREHPNYDFFTSAGLPKMVQKPSPGGQTIGTSQVSVAGVR
jgi:hypothetical protein